MRIQSNQNTPMISRIKKPMKSPKSKNNPKEKKDRYEKGDNFKKATYSNPKFYYNEKLIKKLKEESNRAYSALRKAVENLIVRQGYSIDFVINIEKEVIINKNTQEDAAKLISKDGPLSPEAVSDRIVDFAMALSGGNKDKIPELKAAIDKGFNEAKKILGGLPEVCNKTYDLVMEKLDKWEETH
ncbi:DUF5610 domain-containing protein [Thermohalobacter berrensis]|uniref:Uncharacterized protein n=1 Tax=Thermohalobacter berrensis TaxID=99594 RepID=A0A419T7X7_9FIRM|nr:DUF5610 domain-containing protein [Thermohalobacter berrensis]RKD33488.1 hypothetical protein BET03_08870 [Thermohalobacter berrensis]